MSSFREPLCWVCLHVSSTLSLQGSPSFSRARWPTFCPHTPPPPRPGFRDKEISRVEASLRLDMPHVTFSCRTLLSFAGSCFLELVFLLLIICLGFLVFNFSFLPYCLYLPPVQTLPFFDLGNFDFFSLYWSLISPQYRLVRAERPVFLAVQPWRLLQQRSTCFSGWAVWHCCWSQCALLNCQILLKGVQINVPIWAWKVIVQKTECTTHIQIKMFWFLLKLATSIKFMVVKRRNFEASKSGFNSSSIAYRPRK